MKLKQIVHLLLSITIVAILAYFALGYVGKPEVRLGVSLLSALSILCIYDLLEGTR